MTPVLGVIVRCFRPRRRVRQAASPPVEPPRLSMDQAAALAAKPRVVRRVLALGASCTVAVLPTATFGPTASPPVPIPAVPPGVQVAAPLPHGIGTEPLFPAWADPLPPMPGIDAPALPTEAVPEPGGLLIYAVAVAVAAVALLRRGRS